RDRVNPDRCPTYADALEQQVWGTNGEPDKSADIDHPNDAAGYFIHKEFPVERPAAVVTTLRF
ncbi:terminase, partial [Pseudomonas aeruginosa]|nr:terminase [Pseudomonas aeruginosa]